MSETAKELSVRIHYDWFNKCRTCKHWSGDRAGVQDGDCGNTKSELSGQKTTIDGYCPEWDTYDFDTAIEVMEGRWDYIHCPNRPIPL